VNLIAAGEKTIETRTWATGILAPTSDMTVADEEAACCDIYPKAVARVLEGVRPVEPFPVRGQLGIYTIKCSPKILKRPPQAVLTCVRGLFPRDFSAPGLRASMSPHGAQGFSESPSSYA